MIVITPQQAALQNAYYQQLLQQQRQQETKAVQQIKYDVPQNWSTEETFLKVQQRYFCCGKNQMFIKTSTLGEIVFYRNNRMCGCDPRCAKCVQCILNCELYGHKEIAFKFNNVPSEKCPIEIELCCYKTAIIRYKGTIIGRVECLIENACSSPNRFIIRPIDESREPFILIPIYNCQNFLDDCSGYMCRYPKNIEVQKRGKPYCMIKNSDIKNSQCVFPWDLLYPPYAHGEVTFNPEMKDDEKILLTVGWIIQHSYISGIIR